MNPATPQGHRPTPSDRSPQGLTQAQAAQRLAQQGPNVLAAPERRGLGRTVWAVATEPMFGLLLAAAAIYLLVGDLGEGLLLAAFAALSVGLVVMQEHRSERALEALRELAAPQVRVLREGHVMQIPAALLVPGDWVLVAEGERVPADAVLREASGMSVDESLLTGESVPVRKRPQPVDEGDRACPPPGGEDVPWIYASTLVVAGRGLAEVLSTGAATRVGQIGLSLATIELTPTPLQLQLRRLVRILAAVALGLSLLLVLWYGLRAGAWVQGLLAGIALAMALLPEEFPMALAVFLSLGAWRLARAQVLTRRPAVIEALGAITVLCVDKTGTLTENRMQVRRLVTECCDLDLSEHPADQPWPDSVRRLMEYAMLASHRGGVEPMDAAILGRGDDGLAGTVHLHPDWLLARDYPITPNRLAISRAWTDADGQPRVAAKGAPEAIADLCHLRPEIWDRLQLQVQALAQQGLRVLAVAEGLGSDPAAEDPHDYDFRWLGLLAFEDPLRPSVRPAVGVATRAGIAVVMITGDHPSTALAIAAQAGIDTDAGVLTGQQLQAMDEAALAQAVRSVRVYARVAPQDKLRLVQALRANGETVAMTGDGVNDAPALKAAHVGIAMGRRGTDVAREAASVVLLEEEFGRIVEGVALGRRIFENLRKVMTYIMAIHIPIAGLALLPLLLGLPPLMLPVHVVITEMIIDPVCSLAFENAPQARDAMTRPPRPPQATLVQGAMVRRALCQGAALLTAVLAVYVLALQGGARTDEARALAFIGLTAGNLALVVSNAMGDLGVRALWSRAFLPLWGIALAASGLLALALGWPAARALLQFDVPDFAPLVLAAAAPVGLVLVASQLTARRI